MSFVKPGPLVGYVTGDLIDEADINYWCSSLPDCVDGAGGGTYTLSAPLVFQGDDVVIDDLTAPTIHGDTTVDGSVDIDGDLFVSEGLVVSENISNTGNIACSGTISGRTLEPSELAPDSNTSFNVLSVKNILISVLVESTRTYTLSGAGAVDGEWFIVQNRSAVTQNFTGLVAFSLSAGEVAKYVRISGSWYQFRW